MGAGRFREVLLYPELFDTAEVQCEADSQDLAGLQTGNWLVSLCSRFLLTEKDKKILTDLFKREDIFFNRK